MEKRYTLTLKLDTFVQGTLILFTLVCGILSIFGNNSASLLGLVALFPLGVWQVSSALLFTILLKDTKRRGVYMLSVIGFFAMLCIPQNFEITFLGSPGVYILLPFLAILAIRYFSITMRDMVAASSDYIHHKF